MSDLPPNWYSTQAPDGRTYYYHGVTNETRWTKPTMEDAGGNQGGNANNNMANGNNNMANNNMANGTSNSQMNGSPGSNNSSVNGSPQQQQGGQSGGQGGQSGASSGQQLWKVYKTKEGKSYYFNTITKKTQWNVPEDLQEGGEKKESVRNIPEHLQEGKDKQASVY
jgi:hypothetical protein